MMVARRITWRRATAIGGLLFLLSVAGYYVINRLRSKGHAVEVEHFAHINSLGENRAADDDAWLEIACYNIAHGRGGTLGESNWNGEDRSARLARVKEIGRTLRKLHIDIVVLNEVDFDAAWSHHTDQAALIAEAGGFPYLARQRNFDLAFPFFRYRFGNAILSRWPIVDAQPMPFEPLSPWEDRLAGNHDSIMAKIELPDGAQISLWGVHLEVRDAEVRRKAAQQILKQRNKISGPLLIAGDFNSEYRGELGSADRDGPPTAIETLVDSEMFQVRPALGAADRSLTFPSENADRGIDWILVPADWEVTASKVIRSDLSDHLPVVVTIRRHRDDR